MIVMRRRVLPDDHGLPALAPQHRLHLVVVRALVDDVECRLERLVVRDDPSHFPAVEVHLRVLGGLQVRRELLTRFSLLLSFAPTLEVLEEGLRVEPHRRGIQPWRHAALGVDQSDLLIDMASEPRNLDGDGLVRGES